MVIAFVFPSVDAAARRSRKRRGSQPLLGRLPNELRRTGSLVQRNVVVASNHVSWIDILALNAIGPVRFIAKSEIARWPVLGRLVAGAGTLFIERARRRDTHRVNRDVAAALKGGDIVAVFPEGTTSDGTAVLPFHGSLLQPAIDAGGSVLPVAIRYTTPAGTRSTAVDYVGDVTFVASFWRVCGAQAIVADIVACAPLAATGVRRRRLAADVEAAIRAALASPASGSAPGIKRDRAAGLR